jgi:signal transduction histidine kinase
MGFFRRFNIKQEAEDLGLSVWQAPSVLFFFMGLFTVLIMVLVDFISHFYDSPEILVLSESGLVILIFSVGSTVIRSIEQIARANKIKSEFVTIASHQLKTPLAQINWELELLLSKNKSGLSEKQLGIVNDIRKSQDAMSRLVNDLLDVVRIDQGNLALDRERVNLLEIIDKVIESNKSLSDSSNVEINFIRPKKIPEIVGDKRKISVVIDNLLSNAIKYIEKKGFVEIKVEEADDRINVYVKDNGIGIPDNQQHKVFQKFFRSNNVVLYQTGGTGLGLYISKNFVEQLGGKISFKSIEGVGSDFWFCLPIKNKSVTH